MNYLFICGCGHSGTSLLLSIFSNAANVFTLTDETMALYKMNLDNSKALVSEHVSSQNLVVEKTPSHIYQLNKILGDSSSGALVMLRNPVDVVASLVKRGYSLDAAIKRYRNDNSQMIPHIGDENLFLLKYEELVNQTDLVLNILSKRYGVDLIQGNKTRLFDERLYFKSNGAFEAALTDGFGDENHIALRNYQIRRPIQNMNGQWKNRISNDQLKTVLTELKDMIHMFQYEECFDYVRDAA